MNYKKTRPRSVISFLCSILFCLVLSYPCLAADPIMIGGDGSTPQKVTLSVGKSVIIQSPVMIKRVALDSSDYAGAAVRSPREIIITGKSPGATTASITLTDGRTREIKIYVEPDVALLKEKIYQIVPNEKDIKATGSYDGVVLTGTVSSTANLSQVLALAETYAPRDKDGKPRVMNLLEVGGVHQVMLEVRVSEMSRTLMQRLGVNFNVNYSHNNNTFGVSFLKEVAALPNSLISGIFHTGDVNWTILIDALKENGLTKVLAEPTLITMSGRTANFLAGGEYPIPVPQGGTNNTITIEYKTYGVGLNFTPTVLSNNRISMEVKPEVSDLDFTNALNIYGYVVPALTTRRLSTVIELADGQSFAVAGLLRDDLREVISKFPVLGDIPILGALFRSSSYQKNESELVIIVTPHLVKPVDMAKQTLPTDAFVMPNDFEFFLLGNLEGSGEPARPSKGAVPPRSDKGGLEGDFGHIAPK